MNETRRRLLISGAVMAAKGMDLIAPSVDFSARSVMGLVDSFAHIDAYSGIYKGLDKYKERDLPLSVVKEMVADLKRWQDLYPSFALPAKIISDSLDDPATLGKYDFGNTTDIASFKMRFEDLGRAVAMLSDEGIVVVSSKIELINKSNRFVISTPGLLQENIRPVIIFNSGLPDVKASPWLYRLMVAKEASHYLYMKDVAKMVIDDLDSKYAFPKDQKTVDSLLGLAMSERKPKNVKISPSFDRMIDIIDYAGFGHIALDLAKMLNKGLLTSKDKEILDYNIAGIRKAMALGIIRHAKSDASTFEWKEGSGPLSREWFNIMSEVHGIAA
jgi:hypothetical protein